MAPSDTLPLEARPTIDNSVVVFSDIGCPWAHVLMHRFDCERQRVEDGVELVIEHRAFPLELVNRRPTPKDTLDVQVSVLAEVEPDAGWSPEGGRPWEYPVSTLPALEAVQAATAQSVELGRLLDLALRRAMFAEWACLASHGVVMDVASGIDGLDLDRLWTDIGTAFPRRDVWHHFESAVRCDPIASSPTVVLPDGSVHVNPGLEFHWTDGPGSELSIDQDEPAAVRRLVQRALTNRK